jgi:hypothetical protein
VKHVGNFVAVLAALFGVLAIAAAAPVGMPGQTVE